MAKVYPHHIHMITHFATFLFGKVTVKCACELTAPGVPDGRQCIIAQYYCTTLIVVILVMCPHRITYVASEKLAKVRRLSFASELLSRSDDLPDLLSSSIKPKSLHIRSCTCHRFRPSSTSFESESSFLYCFSTPSLPCLRE
jgi:hypothetical protein